MLLKFSQIRQALQYMAFPVGLVLLCVSVLPIHTLGFELPKFFVLAVLSGFLALTLLLKKANWMQILLQSMPGKLYACFGIVVLVSLLWSKAPIAALLGSAPRFQGVLTHGCFLILGLYGAASMQSTKGRACVSRAIVMTNCIVVVYGVMQMLHLDPYADLWKLESFLGRVFSTIGHPNALGQFVLLTVPFVAHRWLQPSERVVRMAWGALLILNGAVLLGTVSRSALLGAAILGLLCIPSFKVWIAKRIHLVKAEQAFALSLITVLCVSIGLLFFSQRFTLTIEGSRSVSSREVIWESTLNMISDRPYGYGLESMAFTSPKFVSKDIYKYESLTTAVDRAHNEYLQLLLTLGPAGFVTYFSLVVMLLLSTWRYRKTRDTDGYLATATAGILGYQITMFFGFPSIATGALFWLLVGCAVGLQPQREKWAHPGISRVLSLALVGFCAVAVVVSLQWMQSRLIHAYASAVNPLMELSLRQQGILMFQYDRESLIETTELHLRALEDDMGQHTDELIASTQSLIDLLKKTTHSNDGMAWLLQAWLAAVQGNQSEAEQTLATAKTFHPESITYARTAKHIYSLLGDSKQEEEARLYILSLLPPGYFEEGSEMRRILQKQHSWLKRL